MSTDLPPELEELEAQLRQVKPLKVTLSANRASTLPSPVRTPRWGNVSDLKTSRPFQFTLLTLAVVFIVGVIYLLWEPPPQTVPPHNVPPFTVFAQVVNAVNADWANGLRYKRGQELGQEKLHLLSGVVHLRTKHNVEVVLEGPVEFDLRGVDTVFCRAGKISVTVPPEGKGFTVETPHAAVVDIGTEFSLSVDHEKLDIHVIKGNVDVVRPGSDKFRLTTGFAAMLDFNGNMERFEASHHAFTPTDRVHQLWDEYVDRRRHIWNAHRQRITDDPAWLASLSDAVVHGASRVPGKHPESEAFRFSAEHERLLWTMPGEHLNLTIIAVVRLAELEDFTTVLCTGDAFHDAHGEFLLQVDHCGVLHFHVNHPKGPLDIDVPDAFKRSVWKTWTQIAVVVDADARQVRQYIDGKRVAVHPWEEPIPLHKKKGTIGNSSLDRQLERVRYWNGDIHSFDVFSRAFSDEEIAEWFANTN